MYPNVEVQMKRYLSIFLYLLNSLYIGIMFNLIPVMTMKTKFKPIDAYENIKAV